MGMKARSLIDEINPTFFTLTTTAIDHCLSAWNTGKFRVPREFGPGGGAQCKRYTKIINHAGDNTCTDVFRSLDVDFSSSLLEVRAKKIDNICSMIFQRIHSTGNGPSNGRTSQRSGQH